jgi:hypothetical protein
MKQVEESKKARRILFILGFCGAILLQLSWATALRNGVLPRSPETLVAIEAYKASHSEATKQAMFDQIHRDIARNHQHDQIVLCLVLLADVVAIYAFWNYGVIKPTRTG